MKNLYQFIFLFVLINMSFSSYGKNTNTLISLAPPTASISGTTTVCQNAASPLIMFTGSDGTAPYIFKYKINNGASLTVTTTGSNNSITVSAPTSSSGNFTYTLISVSDSTLPLTEFLSSGSAIVSIKPSPDATLLIHQVQLH
jgi:hypothetical protein